MSIVLSVNIFAATSIQELDAGFLYDLGLFNGTDKGYELDKNLTRAEGGVMLVRLLGGEEEALTGDFPCPFTDVAEWANPYVGWLYEKGLTNGTSATTYDPNRNMLMKEYLWFLGRASGYTDEEVAQGKTVISVQSYEAQKDTVIIRGQMVALSMDTLYHNVSGSNDKLAEKLINQGVFTQNEWDKIHRRLETAKMDARAESTLKNATWHTGWVNIDSNDWTQNGYRIYRRMNGKTVAESKILGSDYNLNYGKYGLFVRRYGDFYYLDQEPLQETKIMELTSYWDGSINRWNAIVLARQGDTFLIGDDGSCRLYTWSLDEGLKFAELVERDAVTDVAPIYLTCSEGLVAFEASGAVKIIDERNLYSDIVQKGDVCYYIPRVYSPAGSVGYSEEPWRGLSFSGGLQVMTYENNYTRTLLSLPADSKMRLEKIQAIENSVVTTCTIMWYRAGNSSIDRICEITIKGSGTQAHVVTYEGIDRYPTEIPEEYPIHHSTAELIAWWNQVIFS